jgi:dienelactone hydrolase
MCRHAGQQPRLGWANELVKRTHHSFDNDRPARYVAERTNANAPGGKGATTGGNPAAWADSIREVSEFFAAHLRR